MLRTLAKTLIFTLLVPIPVIVGIPYLALSSGMPRFSLPLGIGRLAGIIPIGIGTAIYLWCAWDFARGQGTPAPIDPPTEVVSRGLYRVVRNPMYVSVLLLTLGEAIFLESGILIAYAALLWVIFHVFVVLYEEPHLRARFGDAYHVYCHTVPRWIPDLKARHIR